MQKRHLNGAKVQNGDQLLVLVFFCPTVRFLLFLPTVILLTASFTTSFQILNASGTQDASAVTD